MGNDQQIKTSIYQTGNKLYYRQDLCLTVRDKKSKFPQNLIVLVVQNFRKKNLITLFKIRNANDIPFVMELKSIFVSDFIKVFKV